MHLLFSNPQVLRLFIAQALFWSCSMTGIIFTSIVGLRLAPAAGLATLPLATVPYLREKTHLPVVVDPSHGTGIASLVPSMSAASVACGADGLIIEVHQNPAKAVSDAAQTLNPAQFDETLATCRKVATALGKRM